MAKTLRFMEIHDEGSVLGRKATILLDLETGVNYLWVQEGNAGGLTPLLNADGTPVMTLE